MRDEIAESELQDSMLPALTPSQLLARLFGSEFRLGWVFRDRNQFFRPWTQAEPPRAVVDPRLERNLRLADAHLHDVPAIFVAWTLIGVTVGAALAPGSQSGGIAGELMTVGTGTLVFAVGAGLWIALTVVGRELARRHYERARRAVEEMVSNARTEWSTARDVYLSSERERVNRIPEWGPVEVGSQLRVDLFGGTLRSWCGLLTTYVTSVVRPGRRVIALDLTGSEIVEEACSLCERQGLIVERVFLPDGLSQLGQVTDLVDLVVQAVHGSDSGGRQDDRMVDMRLLTGMCERLKPSVTVVRLRDGLRVLLGAPGLQPSLTEEEQSDIGGELFPETYVQGTLERVRVLEAYLDQLVVSGAERSGGPGLDTADLGCLSLATDARMSVADLITRAAVHWLITTARGTAGVEAPRAIVIAGADRVPADQLDWLWKACEQAGIQLVAMFHHLRDDPARFLGGGRTVAFMRLGNHAEAEAAANFIGREYRFQLSQLTTSVGGASNETAGTESGASESRSLHRALGLVLPFPHSRTDTHGTQWGSSQAVAESTSWHSDRARQRVHEYRVEPSELQGLPEYAALVVSHQVGGPRLLAVECSPDILTLPRVSPRPLPLDPADESAGLRQMLGGHRGGGE
jgi:hypothetical protein